MNIKDKEALLGHNISSYKLIMNSDLNHTGENMFGGKMNLWLDEIAEILAIRTTCCNCVTRTFKEINYVKPVYLGDILKFNAEIIRVGKTSMDIKIEVYKSNKENNETYIGGGVGTFVAVDEHGKPTENWSNTCRI